MDSALVSVIIPVYNAAEYLPACIESVIAQTWPAMEIIIVDDGSTDNSLTIAHSYQAGNIKIISQPNGGASKARNRGLQEAKGEYIQFLDADDLLSTDKIEAQVQLLKKSNCKVAVCSTVPFYDGEDHLKSIPSAYDDEFLINSEPVHFLINLWGGYKENGSMVQPNAWLCPMHILQAAGPWDESLTLDDDGEYFTRVVLKSEGVIKSEGSNYYRKHRCKANNLSSLTNRKGIASQVRSLMLRYEYISRYENSVGLKTAYARSLSDTALKIYPEMHDITEIIAKEIKNLNISFKFKPVFGTNTGNIISGIFGWKTAKRLQLLLRR